ncbi:TIGR03084 family metal-binding protein [Micromonospora sp. PSH03]|jgi:uncharacterized protein (TIGR03084 family)|uniref:TIGR03084 family metal-binding protein n=1 Tax=Micromonospora TaxID=1873 RepID=UPI001B39B712|nr:MULTISPECIES: TIGR03084 family metal-binding protein [Micromonospora]MBQ0988654.1 TIGR03084 family protein [Micromonospora sp. H61]MCG5454799.1 TIGR03084 family metal-binding protein [Micromonospora salmantinae]
MSAQPDVFADLVSEGDAFDTLIADLDDAGWRTATPAVGWTVAHQVAHLSAVFRLAGLSASDPDTFSRFLSSMSGSFESNVAAAMAPYLAAPPPALFAKWQEERSTAEKALAAHAPTDIVPWLVRPMPAAILAGAGMMELFGHGQDVADALGVERRHTDRIRHLCGFAARTWDFGYLAREEDVPDVEFGYTLTAPSGATWTFGPPDADQRISGPAVDFCLLVTRRRHRDDLRLSAVGPDAEHWLDIAQAYRGPAGSGRQPGQFAAATR